MNDDTSSIMEEPPHAPNFGRKVTHVMAEGAPVIGSAPLDKDGMAGDDFTSPTDPNDVPPWGAGVGIIDTSRGTSKGGSYGAGDMGMTSHRGILHPDEYIDFFALRAQVESEFGHSYEAIASAYKVGRPTAEARQTRDEIDAQVLALSRAGGNMAEFAVAVGLSEKTVDRALARARAAEIEPVPYTPVVRQSKPCFICYAPGTTRKRRTSQSPEKLRGTITLCDEHYAAGYERQPGNPAYWAFRNRH